MSHRAGKRTASDHVRILPAFFPEKYDPPWFSPIREKKKEFRREGAFSPGAAVRILVPSEGHGEPKESFP